MTQHDTIKHNDSPEPGEEDCGCGFGDHLEGTCAYVSVPRLVPGPVALITLHSITTHNSHISKGFLKHLETMKHPEAFIVPTEC